MMWKYGLLLLLLGPLATHAQNLVTGTVTENLSGSTLIGVNILVKGTTTGAVTDVDGQYQISASLNDTLIFSYIGYAMEERVVTSTTLNVTMSQNIEELGEIVVIGYGSARKEDLTGAADLITNRDFNRGPIVSAQQLIAGRVAGLSVSSGGGAPGEGQNILIRGLGSLTLNSSPLIVIDGIPLNDGGVGGSRNPLNLLNPNDIESMVVLKDASATAIYGSRAANGVILITTKKGRATDFTFNYSGSVTSFQPDGYTDVLSADQFRTVVQSTGKSDAIARLGSANTNWQDEIYAPALGNDHALSARGALWGIPLRTSVGYSDHNGILRGDKFQRTTASLNLTPSLLDNHLSLELNARGAYTENTFADRGAIGSAVDYDPTQPVYDPESRFDGYSTWTGTNGYKINLAPTNPVALLNLIDDTSEVRRFIGNAKVNYKLHFLADITATLNAGLDLSNSGGRRATSELIPTSDASWNGSLSRYSQKATNKLLDFYLTYQKDAGNHFVNIVGGYSYQAFDFDNYNYDSEAEEDGNVYEFYDLSKNVLLSYFGRFNYNFKQKYLITATLRADASSKLNPEDRWGYFPSVALAWNLHREQFLQNSAIEELKLRIGYGEVGNVNGLGDYNFLTRYTGSQSTANYQFGNTFYQTYRPEPINENLRWEVGRTLNAGLDYSIFNYRVSGSVNVYRKETRELISNTIIDPFTNFGNRISANIGDMENKGIEWMINLVPVRKQNLEWSINFNGAFNENTVTNLPDQQFVGSISGGTGNSVQTHLEDRSPFAYLVYKQVYDEEGFPIEGAYVDRNGDKLINENDKYLYWDPYPDILMGLGTNLNYKNFDLRIMSRASIGNYNYFNIASYTSYYNRATENAILTNLHSDYLKTRFVNSTESNLLSDHYLQEASYFKLDNVTLGYTFPSLVGNSSLKIYCSAQNLLTITDYEGVDPEIPGGIDNNFYPRPRSFVFGVNIDF